MDAEEQEPRRSKQNSLGRRRNEQSHRAILDSAIEILHEQGYRALTIEGIAARAGVGKQTIYRWWSSKAAIVLEALTADTQERIPTPDTGSMRTDLEILLRGTLNELAQRSGPIVRSLMAEAQFDTEFGRAFREDFIAHRRAVMLEVLRRGQARGEIDEMSNLELIVDLIYGPMWYRLLNQHAPLDGQFIQQLLEWILVGL